MKPKVSIIVPVKNEALNLPDLFNELENMAGSLGSSFQFHVLLVDDGSEDQTVSITKQTNPANFSLGLCRFTRNFGKEAAIAAGLDRCDSDAYIVMDADLQHPPSMIPQMLQYWQNGYLVVEAVKTDRGNESVMYKLLSSLFYSSMRSMSPLSLEGASDFKLLDRKVVNEIRKLPEKSRFFRGLVSWLGFTAKQINFDVPERNSGTSSWSVKQLIYYSLRSITAFTSAPLQIVTLIGILMLSTSVVLGSISLIQWISGQAVTGFTTVILLLLLIGSMLMVSMGIIGLYISRIFDEIKARPIYAVREEFNLSPPQRGLE